MSQRVEEVSIGGIPKAGSLVFAAYSNATVVRAEGPLPELLGTAQRLEGPLFARVRVPQAGDAGGVTGQGGAPVVADVDGMESAVVLCYGAALNGLAAPSDQVETDDSAQVSVILGGLLEGAGLPQ